MMQWRRIDGVNEPSNIRPFPKSTPVLVGFIDPTMKRFDWQKGKFYKTPENGQFFQGNGMSGDWVFTHFMEIEPPSGEET